MNADSLIRDFYSALSRDLLIYMIVVAIAAVVAWCSWFNQWTKHRRTWFTAAIVLTLVTHDNRILDIADRIVYMEDGRLANQSNAVYA